MIRAISPRLFQREEEVIGLPDPGANALVLMAHVVIITKVKMDQGILSMLAGQVVATHDRMNTAGIVVAPVPTFHHPTKGPQVCVQCSHWDCIFSLRPEVPPNPIV